MQEPSPATLALGTQVSAKYKGAFCEAKVKKVDKQVKVRLTFREGACTSHTLSDEYVRTPEGQSLCVGAIVKARSPDKGEYFEAVVNRVMDQSMYTVVFDDGDITTLRRNALCMKSGKHFKESLDNLPLTHPEHFGTPVGGRKVNKDIKRRRGGPNAVSANKTGVDSDVESEEEEEEEVVSSSYLANIGRVVYAEHTDKKSSKANWFPALIVSPSASGQVKIDTKDDFLIRSFKDGRYYTVSKTDTSKFSKDNQKKYDNPSTSEAREKANTYLEKDELPPHWDKEILFNMGEESTTESSETESITDEDEDEETPEEKDHLVAELFKHMEDRGQPINKTPSIAGRDVDLYRLFRIVFKLGGHTRVTNNNLWRAVALKLGFETTWCINQVRVHYKRYLHSFEELNRTLGCTMINHPRSKQGSGQSSRVQIRGKHRSGNSSAAASPMAAPIQGLSGSTSGDSSDAKTSSGSDSVRQEDEIARVTETDKMEKKEEVVKKEKKKDKDVIKSTTASTLTREKAGKRKDCKEETPVKEDDAQIKVAREEAKMTTRPRRDSTSSLAAAIQLKGQKDTIGEDRSKPIVRVDRDRETENEARKLQARNPRTSTSTSSSSTNEEDSKKAQKEKRSRDLNKEKKESKDPKKDPHHATERERSRGPPSSTSKKKSFGRKRVHEEDSGGPDSDSRSVVNDEAALEGVEEKQRIPPEVVVQVGDKIRVCYKCDMIYEAKVVKIVPVENHIYPKYYVHYQGWNARYDEYIKRSNIAENITYNRDKDRQAKSKAKYAEAKSLGLPCAESITTRCLSTDDKDEVKSGNKAGHSGRDRHSGRAARGSFSLSGSLKERKSEARASTPSRGTATSSNRTTSPIFKRQSSRNSKKESEESEGDECSSETASRKSQRIGNTKSVPVSEGRRSGRKGVAMEKRDESEIEEHDGESDSSKIEVTPRKKRGRRAEKLVEESSSEDASSALSQRPVRVTASRDRTVTRQSGANSSNKTKSASEDSSPKVRVKSEDEDPYAFKEPERFGDSSSEKADAASSVTPKKTSESPSSQAISKDVKNERRGTASKSEGHLIGGPDSAESRSAEENVKRTRSGRPMVIKAASAVKVEEDSTSRESGDTPEGKASSGDAGKASQSPTSPGEKEEAAIAPKAREDSGSDLIKRETCEDSPATESQSKSDLSEANSSNDGRPVLQFNKKQQELFPFLSAIRTTTVAARNAAASSPAKEKDDSSSTSKSPKPAAKTARKRKMPRKPNSSELVESESESDDISDIANDNKKRAESTRPSERAASSRKRALPTSGSETKAEEACSTSQAKKSTSSAPSAKKEEQDDLDLACGETIPGSPVSQALASAPGAVPESASPPASSQGSASSRKPGAPSGKSASSDVSSQLEMPFASVPESVSSPAGAKEKKATPPDQQTSTPPSYLPARRAFPADVVDDLETPDMSSASQSSRETHNQDGGESSELDLESITGRKVGSEGSTSMKIDGAESEVHLTASHRGRGGLRRKFESTTAARPSDAFSSSPKRRRKPREAAHRGGRAGRGRYGSGKQGARTNDEETDDSEEHKDSSSFPGSLNRLDNDQLRELAQRPKNAKYNFFVNLEEIGDSNERITKIQESIDNLKSTYLNMKSELALLDRKSKKLKRKEREKGERESRGSSAQLEVTA